MTHALHDRRRVAAAGALVLASAAVALTGCSHPVGSAPASDDVALRAAVREALGAPDVVALKSANARRLHESVLAPPVATRALASLCREGTTRMGKRALPAGSLRRRLAQEAARIARTFGEGPGFGGAG